MNGDPPSPGGRVALPIVAAGWAALVGQTLLFRSFLGVLGGSELGVAAFFCSWLVWSALGAAAAVLLPLRGERLAAAFPFAPLLFGPAFLLQDALLLQARALAGVTAFEVFPLADLLPAAFLVNAPAPFVAGLLFTVACRRLAGSRSAPAARVFALEALGGFAGGLCVTALLGLGLAPAAVYGAGLLPAAAAAAVPGGSQRRTPWLLRLLPLLLLVAAGLSPLPGRWTRQSRLHAWSRLLPADGYRGAFTTPEARYLYGRYGEPVSVVAWETVHDTVPQDAYASRVAALLLAQQPGARRFLVLGQAACATALRLLDLPRTESVTWLDPDPDYPAALLHVLPPAPGLRDDRLHVPARDPRLFLRETGQVFDAVFLNLPDTTTLAFNRFATDSFYRLVRNRLAPDGVVGVRVSAGETYMGDELVALGASVFTTLGSVFEHVVVQSGDESWLLASDAPLLSTRPGVLRRRFASVPGADALFPSEGLFTLYEPDRIAFETAQYRAAAERAGAETLLNADARPRALVHALALAAHAAGIPGMNRVVQALSRTGFAVLALCLAALAVARALYRVRTPGPPAAPRCRPLRFDLHLLLLTTGAVGMSTGILLLYAFQSAHGALYLYVGLLSALLMLGLAAGSGLADRLLRRGVPRVERGLPALLLLHAGLLVLLRGVVPGLSIPGFAGLCFLVGLLGGLYVPVVVRRFEAAGLAPAGTGAAVAWGDNLGGAVGGLLTGLVVLPLLGVAATAVLLSIALLVNLAGYVPAGLLARASTTGPRVRAAGYALAAAVLTALVVSSLVAAALAPDPGAALRDAAREMVPDRTWQGRRAVGRSGEPFPYLVAEPEGTHGAVYVYRTGSLAPEASGYGGPLDLAVAVSGRGELLGTRLLASNETPAYLREVTPWRQRLRGRSLFDPDGLRGVDGLSGATLTCEGVLEALRSSGPRFAVEALHLDVGASSGPAGARNPSLTRIAALGLFALLALWLRVRPSRPARLLFLAAVAVVLGGWFNVQLSLAHLADLAALELPSATLSVGWVLALAVPVGVLLLGNLYCGYLCPFGALQELLAALRPARLAADPDLAAQRWGRRVKYAVLAALALLFALTRDPAVATADPLVTLFAGDRRLVSLPALAFLLAAAFFYGRLWCRALCPVGAFLSCLNALRPLRRWLPRVAPARCAYGVQRAREQDCLLCDACRGLDAGRARQIRAVRARPAHGLRRAGYILMVAALLGWLGWRVCEARMQGRAQTLAPARPAAGSRPADAAALRRLIEQGRLSGREAMYYRRRHDD